MKAPKSVQKSEASLSQDQVALRKKAMDAQGLFCEGLITKEDADKAIDEFNFTLSEEQKVSAQCSATTFSQAWTK